MQNLHNPFRVMPGMQVEICGALQVTAPVIGVENHSIPKLQVGDNHSRVIGSDDF
jgi:hypothetical protein